MQKTREFLAQKLQTAICNAIGSQDEAEASEARKWLLLYKKPTADEVLDPERGSFIATCRALGLNWYDLKASLEEATEIEIPILRLVHADELSYNESYEKSINSVRISETKRS